MKKLMLIFLLVASTALAVKPQKKKERDAKLVYMEKKAAWLANPTQGKYNQMMKARADMSTEVIKWRKERKKK